MDLGLYEQSLANIRQKYLKKQQESLVKTQGFYQQKLQNKPIDYVYSTPSKTTRIEKNIKPNTQNSHQENTTIFNPTDIAFKKEKSLKSTAEVKWSSNKIERRDVFTDRISEKEKKINERMQINERLLRKSKDLRQAENRKQSVGKYDNIHITVETINDLKLNLGKTSITSDKVEKALTQRVNRLESTVKKTKYDFEKEVGDAKLNFSQRLKDILKNSQKSEKYNVQQPKEFSASPVSKLDSGKKEELGIPVGCAPPTKINSIFQDTVKVQQRIKALLSSHS